MKTLDFAWVLKPDGKHGRLGDSESKMLGKLMETYPRAIEPEKLIEAAGYVVGSRVKGFLALLVKRRYVVTEDDGKVRASDNLYQPSERN